MDKLALGTVQFGLDYGIANQGGQVLIDEVRGILDYAKQNNINTLDTAPSYGNSEQVLGKVGIDNFHVVTKTAPLKLGVKNVLQSFHQSLKSLKTNNVDGLLVHNIDDTQDKQFDLLYEELNQLKQQGLINKIGFSTYTPEQVNFLLENFDFDLIQLPFNIFDTRLIEGGELQALKNKGVEVHARSVFLQGLLLNFERLDNYFSKWRNDFDIYQEMVKESDLSLLEYALNFALSIQEIDKILVGVNSEKQLREITQAVDKQSDLHAYPINNINLLNPSLWKI